MAKKCADFFDDDLSQSLEDYIEAIYILIQNSKNACVRDVAKVLNVKMPSVVKAICELKKNGFVIQEPYGTIELTPKGKKRARAVATRHTLLCNFLVKLGVSRETADLDACRMEHILSAETIDKIRLYTGEKDEKSNK